MSAIKKKKNYVIVSLTLALLLSACSNGGNGGGTTPDNSQGGNESASPSPSTEKRDAGGLELPIVDDKLTLSLWSPAGGNFRGTNFNEKLSFQKMEENTNIHIDFQHASEASDDAFNLLMSSGQLPDIIYHSAWERESAKYGNMGALLPLEDLIDEHAPNLKRILDENPEIRGQITSPEGHIYYLPNLMLNNDNLTMMFPQVRQDWLDKLGLDAPETTDDWYEMLKAFREEDPNENGAQDEIPLVTVSLRNIMYLFAPAFGVDMDFFVEDGEVKYGPYDPRFQEVVEYLNKLYNERLLDPNYLVDNTFQSLTEKVTTDVSGAWFGWAGSYMGNFTTLMEGQHDTFKIAPVAPPKGPRGDQRHASFRYPAAALGLAVSAQTNHPEEVIKWLDYQYSEEGIILNNFGVEGESYDMVDGEPVYKDEVLFPEDGLTNTQVLLNHTIGGGSWATVEDPRYSKQIQAANGQTENPLAFFADYLDFDFKLPPVQFTAEESDVVVSGMADIETYVDETINAIIMGRIPVDQYNTVIERLDTMGIERVLEQYQTAYDRFTENQ